MSVTQSNLPPSPAFDSGQCIANISPVERRKRLIAGMVGFVLGAAILGALVAVGADRWWRVGLFPLFAGAAATCFQAFDKT